MLSSLLGWIIQSISLTHNLVIGRQARLSDSKVFFFFFVPFESAVFVDGTTCFGRRINLALFIDHAYLSWKRVWTIPLSKQTVINKNWIVDSIAINAVEFNHFNKEVKTAEWYRLNPFESALSDTILTIRTAINLEKNTSVCCVCRCLWTRVLCVAHYQRKQI